MYMYQFVITLRGKMLEYLSTLGMRMYKPTTRWAYFDVMDARMKAVV